MRYFAPTVLIAQTEQYFEQPTVNQEIQEFYRNQNNVFQIVLLLVISQVIFNGIFKIIECARNFTTGAKSHKKCK